MKKRHTRKKKLISQAGQFAAPISEPKFSMPPLSPVDAELDQLANAAKNGDTTAVSRLKAIQERCREILDKLPPKFTKKKPSLEKDANALADKLMEEVFKIRNGMCQGGGGSLEVEIKKLEPLSPAAAKAWWMCAWKLMQTTKNREFKTLFSIIGSNRSQKLWRDKFPKMQRISQEIQAKVKGIADKMEVEATKKKDVDKLLLERAITVRKMDWRSYPDAAKVTAIRRMIKTDSGDYARRQTMKAFIRLVKSSASK